MSPVETVSRAIDPATAADRNGRDQIREAARQFESLFMEQLIRQMRDAQLDEGFFGKGSGSSIYEGMFTDYMADHLSADSPLGIARLLEERWSGRAEGAEESSLALRTAETERATRAYTSAGQSAEPAGVLEARPRRTPGVSREYGWGRDPIEGHRRFHQGIDLPSPQGTPVVAVAPGWVVSRESTPGYGLSVVLRHGAGWTTRYAHLSEAEVRPGQQVARGQVLGQVGSTGRSTGPHLHFEALLEGRRVDPGLAAPGDLRPQVLRPQADEIQGRKR